MAWEFRSLASGDQGTDQTIIEMQRFVREGAFDQVVRSKAVSIVAAAGVAPKDYRAEVAAIFAFVRDHIRYTLDPVSLELVQSPRVVLEVGAGDCDDKAVLLAALLESIGHETRFVVMGNDPEQFEHVLVQVNDGAGWVSLDPTFDQADPGFEPGPVLRRREYAPMFGSYDVEGVDNAIEVYGESAIARAAAAQVDDDVRRGRLGAGDVGAAGAFLSGGYGRRLPRQQRRLLQGIARAYSGQAPALAGLGAMAGFFDSVWNGIKKVAGAVWGIIKSGYSAVGNLLTLHPGAAIKNIAEELGHVATVASVVGPFLVFVPGVGQVTALAVTAAGTLIAPGQDVPDGARVLDAGKVGEYINVTGGVVEAYTPPAATDSQVVTAGWSSVPWWAWAGLAGVVLAMVGPGGRQ